MKKLRTALKSKNFPFWITDKYIYAMLFIFPLFTGFHGYTQVTVSKYIFFASITSLWLAALLIGVINAKFRISLKHLGTISFLLIFYFFFCCVSSVFSPFKASVIFGKGRFDGLVTIFLCTCICLGVARFARPKPAYIYAAAASSSLNCIVAVIQLFGLNPLKLFPGEYTYFDAGTKFSSVFLGTIGNADLFSALLCLALPLTAVYYITSEKRQTALLFAIALSSFCLFTCRVAGGILAFIVCVVVTVPFIVTDSRRLCRMTEVLSLLCLSLFASTSFETLEQSGSVAVSFFFSRRSAALLILSIFFIVLRFIFEGREFSQKALRTFFLVLSVSFFAAGVIIIYYWKGTEGTVYEISQFLHGNTDDKFGSSRILIWRNVLKLVPERLLLGGGPGTLPLRLDLHFSRYVEETGKTLRSYVDNAHNDYLGILVNTGLLSLIPYMAAQCISLIKSAKAAKLSSFCACLACSLICYWIQAFFGLGLFLVSPVMWLIWGLLLSSLRCNKKDTAYSKPAADI